MASGRAAVTVTRISGSSEELDRLGFTCSRDTSTSLHLDALRGEFDRLLAVRQQDMRRNGIVDGVAGTAHHLVERGSPMLAWMSDIMQSPSMAWVTGALDGKCVLNSFGGVDNRANTDSYVGKVHRDVRSFTREARLMMQFLVPLDPFTAETGATWLLPGSHLNPAKPADDEFFAGAVQIEAAPGDVIVFDSRLWHAAGVNRTSAPRRALTLTFTRPFLKPQFDYCRHLGEEYVATLSEPLQQLLGYFARIPATLDEWYRPPERRLYRPGQG